MHRRPSRASLPPATLLFCLLVFFFGCNAVQLPDLAGLSSAVPGNSSASTINEDPADNSLFAGAQPVALPDDGTVTIDGSIDSKDDVDIYALGPAKAGDKIIVDIAGADGLNTVAALFDGNHNLIDANDDRSYYSGQLDPYIRQVIRADTDNLYLGVAVTRSRYFSSTSGRYDTGTYTAKISRTPAQTFTAARTQVVYLDFRGGASVQIAAQPVEQMRPFSAESISSRLAGQTDYLIQQVAAMIRADYTPYQVEIYDSASGPPPDAPHSTLYFGNYNKAFLGLSDNVDVGNVSLVQESIIYTEDFAMFENLQGSADEIAQLFDLRHQLRYEEQLYRRVFGG